MIELIDRRDLDDQWTATTSRIELIDRRDQGDPETEATAGMIERVDRPLHLRPPHQPYRLGRDDPDMDSLHSPTAPLEAE